MNFEWKCHICKESFITVIDTLRDIKIYCSECSHTMQKARCVKYKQKNRNYVSSYNKKYKAENKKEVSKYNKRYNVENRTAIQVRQTAQHNNRRKTDPAYKFSVNMRTYMGKFMKGTKGKKTTKLLGCTFDDMILWIKYQLKSGMTMENHGIVWHYDHVIPCALFDQTNTDEQEKCWHWSNYQPMIGTENMAKSDKVSATEIKRHLKKIDAFIEKHSDEISDEMTLIEYNRECYANC